MSEIEGINHITLSVRDLEESFKFYTKVLKCRPLVKWKRGAYLQAGGVWLCLSVDRHTRTKPLDEYTHIAFQVNEFDLRAVAERIRQSRVRIWKENTSEGQSLYFLDPNGHRLELHATSLKDRLAHLKDSPYDGLTWFIQESEDVSDNV